ncbi:MAG: hypothetical protein ASARMPREDX12_004523 [Alectoria sarmentosa]|nr:MAG: hypothetical protein ASARMPREDX12_004523 [Alectoria sarmentosa]
MPKAPTKDTHLVANAPGPGWQRQQPAKTDSDIFDNDDQAPESPAASRALPILESRRRSEAPPTPYSLQPFFSCTATMPVADALLLRPFMGCNEQQRDIDDTPLRPHEHSLNHALTRMQLRIRQSYYTSPRGAQDWQGDVAHLKELAVSAYGKRALGWCEIAQHMVEEERGSQARNIREKDAVMGELRREYDGLRRYAGREIGNLKREVAELKGLVPWR